MDWDALRRTVHLSTHFLDNVIDANQYPLQAISDLAQTIRRIGLGVMGWADMLVGLAIPYDSAEGVEMGRKVMGFLNEEARNASENLAETRGPFPAWEESIWGPDDVCARHSAGHRVRPMRKLRNCNLTTVAPTGTISIFAGCSGGIEPIFAVAFHAQPGERDDAGRESCLRGPRSGRRVVLRGAHVPVLRRRVTFTSPRSRQRYRPSSRRRTTSHQEWHVRMQAAFQEHTDSAIPRPPTSRHRPPRTTFGKSISSRMNSTARA